jgi:hypothetical protein
MSSNRDPLTATTFLHFLPLGARQVIHFGSTDTHASTTSRPPGRLFYIGETYDIQTHTESAQRIARAEVHANQQYPSRVTTG